MEIILQVSTKPFPREARPASIPTPSADNEPLDLFKGDIMLSPEDIIFLNEGQYRGKESGNSPAHNGQNNAERNRRELWVTRIVPYELPESMKAEYEATIDAAIKEYHEKTCLKFVNHTTEKNWIRFVNSLGCESRVGKNPDRVGYQEVSLGHGCNDAGTAIHELMHAVGFFHEQARPDRDDYVKIFWENIPKAPVDGHWGRWSDWGACSTSCGPGSRKRVRTCNDPPPMYGGDDCNGIKSQTKYCKIKACGLGPDDCDFDFEGGWCIWKVVKPGGPWYLQTGPTSSDDTGPDDDHSGDGGRYIYFESSSPLQSGEHGKVESKTFPSTQESCLTFYYYMYGKEMGTLSVFIQTSNSRKRIWGKTGDQGQEWHRVDISFVSDLDQRSSSTPSKALVTIVILL